MDSQITAEQIFQATIGASELDVVSNNNIMEATLSLPLWDSDYRELVKALDDLRETDIDKFDKLEYDLLCLCTEYITNVIGVCVENVSGGFRTNL